MAGRMAASLLAVVAVVLVAAVTLAPAPGVRGVMAPALAAAQRALSGPAAAAGAAVEAPSITKRKKIKPYTAPAGLFIQVGTAAWARMRPRRAVMPCAFLAARGPTDSHRAARRPSPHVYPQERASKGLPGPGQHFSFGALKPWDEILAMLGEREGAGVPVRRFGLPSPLPPLRLPPLPVRSSLCEAQPSTQPPTHTLPP